MSENILVVEYEPRYTDRVRQALAGQPITASFARDGEEALRALDAGVPRLVVLSSVIPKGNPADLIRAIRGRSETTRILLTVSGYNGNTPAQDAMRVGASDILPKPYSEGEFLGKVQQLLGDTSASAEGQVTSNDLFGDIVDPKPAQSGSPGRHVDTDDIDKLLSDTLIGVMPKKSVTSPGTAPKPKGTSDIDKLVQDTLSGLEKKKTATGSVPIPKAVPSAAPAPSPAPVAAVSDRIPISQPVFPPPQPPAPAKEEPEPADGVRFGQYVLLERIASGGMAEIWKARKSGEEGFQKIVAIKKILPHLSDNQDFIEMFIDEAKLAAQLTHNNIIHIYDLGKIGNSYFIAMEYVDGHDLKTILKQGQERDQPLGAELSLFVASKVAAALDYAHRKRDFDEREMGLVHRDVSPQNVLISQEGDIKLCDFGIAKAASKASHTQAGALKGKLQYMSPEQAWGRPIDRRSDIFALATVLFEMLTGRKLFTGDNEMSILEQVREAHVTPPSQLNDEVTPQVDAILLKALQKDPENRYQTAADLAKDLESVLYTFRPTPTSADLAIYMHRLWSPEPAKPSLHEEPTIIQELPHAPRAAAPAAARHIAPAVKPVTSPGVAMPAWDAPPAAAIAQPRKKRSVAVPLLIVALLAGGGVGGYFYFTGRPASGASREATPAEAPAAVAALAPPATADPGTLAPVPTETTSTAPTATVAETVAPPPLDTALIDIEVQRRLSAERTRLEQQAAAAATRQQQQTATAAPPRPGPQPAVTQTVAPPPAEEPPPTATTQPAQTAETAPAPAVDTAPAEPRYREGDLVPQGTEGLTPGRVIRLGSVPYPPMARSQRVEGTVLVNVLISERGEVLEVRMVRGINRPVGINEAAEQVIRRSTFSAPMLRDGTRVKAWTIVPVKFEL